MAGYDTGNGRLNPPKPSPRGVDGNHRANPNRELKLEASFAAVRALDLPAAAEASAQRRARGRRDRAHARCRRRRGGRRDAAAAARRRSFSSANPPASASARSRPGWRATLSQLGQFGLPPDWTPGARPRVRCRPRRCAKCWWRSSATCAWWSSSSPSNCRGCAPSKSADAALKRKLADRDARGLRAARQPARRLAGEVGARGSGVPLPAAGRVQAHRGGAEGAPLRARALHRGAERACCRANCAPPASRRGSRAGRSTSTASGARCRRSSSPSISSWTSARRACS